MGKKKKKRFNINFKKCNVDHHYKNKQTKKTLKHIEQETSEPDRCAELQKEPYGRHYGGDEKSVGGISIQRVWWRRARWCKKDEVASEAELFRRDDVSHGNRSQEKAWWRGRWILARTNRQWVTVIDKRGRKHRPLSKGWGGGVVGGGGLKILEGFQLYLLFCQQTMPARDRQGWRHRIQSEHRVRQTAKRELKTLEWCQVCLLLTGPDWSQGGRKKAHRPNMELLFSCHPCLQHRGGQKEGKDIDRFVDCNRKRDSLLLGQCVSVCV